MNLMDGLRFADDGEQCARDIIKSWSGADIVRFIGVQHSRWLDSISDGHPDKAAERWLEYMGVALEATARTPPSASQETPEGEPTSAKSLGYIDFALRSQASPVGDVVCPRCKKPMPACPCSMPVGEAPREMREPLPSIRDIPGEAEAAGIEDGLDGWELLAYVRGYVRAKRLYRSAGEARLSSPRGETAEAVCEDCGRPEEALCECDPAVHRGDGPFPIHHGSFNCMHGHEFHPVEGSQERARGERDYLWDEIVRMERERNAAKARVAELERELAQARERAAQAECQREALETIEDNAAGYDIQSWRRPILDAAMSEWYIEVKASSEVGIVHLTRNEWHFGSAHADRWELQVWFENEGKPLLLRVEDLLGHVARNQGAGRWEELTIPTARLIEIAEERRRERLQEGSDDEQH